MVAELQLGRATTLALQRGGGASQWCGSILSGRGSFYRVGGGVPGR
jgi:hypothetical protein